MALHAFEQPELRRVRGYGRRFWIAVVILQERGGGRGKVLPYGNRSEAFLRTRGREGDRTVRVGGHIFETDVRLHLAVATGIHFRIGKELDSESLIRRAGERAGNGRVSVDAGDAGQRREVLQIVAADVSVVRVVGRHAAATDLDPEAGLA